MAKGLCFPGVVAMAKGRYVLSAEQEDWLRLVFPVTENRRVARAMGVGERTMHRMAEGLGLPQLTGVNVERYTKRQICQRHSAVRRGYLVGDPRGDERMMIFWDGETERAERFERNLAASGFVVMADTDETAAVHGYYVVGARD